jgi:hypothetical protein
MSSRSLVPAIGRCRSCSLAGGLAKRALWVFRNAGRNAFAASISAPYPRTATKELTSKFGLEQIVPPKK